MLSQDANALFPCVGEIGLSVRTANVLTSSVITPCSGLITSNSCYEKLPRPVGVLVLITVVLGFNSWNGIESLRK